MTTDKVGGINGLGSIILRLPINEFGKGGCFSKERHGVKAPALPRIAKIFAFLPDFSYGAALPDNAPVAQLDRASDYESEG